ATVLSHRSGGDSTNILWNASARAGRREAWRFRSCMTWTGGRRAGEIAPVSQTLGGARTMCVPGCLVHITNTMGRRRFLNGAVAAGAAATVAARPIAARAQ